MAPITILRGPTGALLIGDAETVAKKIMYVNEVLSGISRITFQMGVSTLPHQKMLRAIEILGTRVAPILDRDLTASPAHGQLGRRVGGEFSRPEGLHPEPRR
jgi:hypothetical protein